MGPSAIHTNRNCIGVPPACTSSRLAAVLVALAFAALGLGLASAPARAATLAPALREALDTKLDLEPIEGRVIVTFQRTGALLGEADLDVLRAVGITSGHTHPYLRMVTTRVTVGQLRALDARPEIRSVWTDDPIELRNEKSRIATGVDRMQAPDSPMTHANGGLPFDGTGVIIVINDTGIDALHPDLPYGTKVVQNVIHPDDEIRISGVPIPTGFEACEAIEEP